MEMLVGDDDGVQVRKSLGVDDPGRKYLEPDIRRVSEGLGQYGIDKTVAPPTRTTQG